MRKFFDSITKRLARTKSRSSAAPRRGHHRNRLQRFEQLEQRTLLSISGGAGVLNFDDALAEFPGIDGTGVSIGLIANGAEATAMSEILLDADTDGGGPDLAEGVALGATVTTESATNETEFVTAVATLQDAGVDIIIAAPGIYEQAWFQDGNAAQAAQNVIAGTDAEDGTGSYDPIVFVSAAGDDGQIHYQGAYSELSGSGHASKTFTHEFGDSSYLLVVDAGAGVVDVHMEWSEPFGSPTDAYYLYMYGWDGSNWQFLTSDTTLFGTTYLSVSHNNTGGTQYSQIAVQVTDEGFDIADDTLEIIFTGPVSETSDGWITTNGGSNDYTPNDAIFGPAAVESVMTAGTAHYTTPLVVADDSSRGPSTVGGSPRSSLDGIGVDNVTFSGGTATGTSVAAAYTGGIAALMLDMDPGLTPAVVHASLVDTAHVSGDTAPTPNYDNIRGNGLFDALEAMLDANSLTEPNLTDGTDRGVSNSDELTNTNDGDVTFDGT
ncbi:MAG: hypothetical protein HQ518_12560, partial [Rhodopirellula sp.]|nr:hypothetical protein [Rhodopirellula sp.]